MLNNKRRTLIMVTMIAAGETIFLLPFVVARIFRPTFLEVFDLTNLQLGSAFALYGVVAMVSYFFGGPLADRFSARKLMALALLITSVGGILFATIPSLPVLTLLYGVWGITTILLFWAALIRATREWGGSHSQGFAYGILDGGRGLFAALLASLSVWIFAGLLPDDPTSANLAERTAALKQVIWIFTLVVVLVALMIWTILPGGRIQADSSQANFNFSKLKPLLNNRMIWLQAIVVVCAYVGYKATDDFSLFVADAFNYNQVAAAKIGTISFWVRPVAAVAAGILADRSNASTMALVGFALMFFGSLALGLGILQANMYWALILVIISASAGIYAVRGIYFALIDEADIPLAVTGSAVGLVSVIGFTPDVFMGPLMGFLIDSSPGALGHQHVFLLLSVFAATGFAATSLFRFYKNTKI